MSSWRLPTKMPSNPLMLELKLDRDRSSEFKRKPNKLDTHMHAHAHALIAHLWTSDEHAPCDSSSLHKKYLNNYQKLRVQNQHISVLNPLLLFFFQTGIWSSGLRNSGVILLRNLNSCFSVTVIIIIMPAQVGRIQKTTLRHDGNLVTQPHLRKKQ